MGPRTIRMNSLRLRSKIWSLVSLVSSLQLTCSSCSTTLRSTTTNPTRPSGSQTVLAPTTPREMLFHATKFCQNSENSSLTDCRLNDDYPARRIQLPNRASCVTLQHRKIQQTTSCSRAFCCFVFKHKEE